MPSYFNPSSMFGGLTPNNPLQNGLAGARMAYEQKQADDDIQSRQVDLLSNLNKYYNDVADNPLKDSERATKMSQLGADKELIDSGEYARRKVADTDSVVARTKETQQDTITKENMNKGNWLVELANDLDKNPINGIDDQPRWDAYVKEGDKLGVKLPPVADQRTVQMIKAKSQAFVNSAAQQRSMQAEGAKDAAAMARVQAQNKSQEGIHEGNNRTQVKVAKIQAGSRENVADTNAAAKAQTQVPRSTAQLAAQAKDKAAKGQPVSDIEKQAVADVEWIEAKKGPSGALLTIEALKDPTFEDGWKTKKIQQLFGNSGSTTQTTSSKYTPKQQADLDYFKKKNPTATEQEIIDGLKAQKRW